MTLPYDIVCASDDRDSWLRARRSGIGASEVAAIFGESRWRSAIELYADKVGEGRPNEEESEAQFWGLRLERTIAEVFAERTGRHVEWSGQMLRSKEHPWALATLDARCWEHDVQDPWPLDSKTASVFKQGEWSEGPPREYYLQAQQQMLVTGAQRATLACLLGGQRLVWCDIERDEIEIRRIIRGGRIFWEQNVLAQVPPAPDGSDSASRALLKLYPDSEGGLVDLGVEFEDLFHELSEFKASKTALDKRCCELEAKVKAALGNAELGLLPSGRSFTWKNRRGNIDYKRAAHALGAPACELEKYRGKSTRVLKQHAARNGE